MELAKISSISRISKSELPELFSDYNTAITKFIDRIKSSKSPMDKALIKFLNQAKDNKAIFLWSLDQLQYLSENAKEFNSRNLMIGGGGSPRKMFLSVFLIILLGFFMNMNMKNVKPVEEEWHPRRGSGPPQFLQTPEGQIARGLADTFRARPPAKIQDRDYNIVKPLEWFGEVKVQEITEKELNKMIKIIRNALNAIEPDNFSNATKALKDKAFTDIIPASLRDVTYDKIGKSINLLTKVHSTGDANIRTEKISNNIQTTLIHKNLKDLLQSTDRFLNPSDKISISTSVSKLDKSLIDYNQGVDMITRMPWTELKEHIRTTLNQDKLPPSDDLSKSIDKIVKSVYTKPLTTTADAVVNVTKEGTKFVEAGTGLVLAYQVGGAIAAGVLILKNLISKGDSARERSALATTRELAISRRRGVLMQMLIKELKALLTGYGVTPTTGTKPVLVDRIIKHEQENNLIP
jgi:hypothetical protein